MKKIVSLIILFITTITFYGQMNQYSQIVKPAPYVPPIDLGLYERGQQYKSQQFYQELGRRTQVLQSLCDKLMALIVKVTDCSSVDVSNSRIKAQENISKMNDEAIMSSYQECLRYLNESITEWQGKEVKYCK